jgi:hypothetical protein
MAGELQNYTVDQLAGAIALTLGALGSLLLVVWQSRCHCKCNLCYVFQCERQPPPVDPEAPAEQPGAQPEPEAEPEQLIPGSGPEPEPEPGAKPKVNP